MSNLKFLTSEQKQYYDENGFVKLSNILTSQEAEEISQEYDELFKAKQRENDEGLEATWAGDDVKKLADSKKCTVKSIHNLQMHSAVFTRLITNAKLLDALEDIMETGDILLHHTKAHLKPPENGSPFPVHQDYHYFPHKNHTPVAVFVHLDDTTPENGGLAVYPGSHKLGPLDDLAPVGDNKIVYHYVDPKRYPLSGAEAVNAEKGEIVIFSYLLLHGSYLNTSNRTRRMFLMQVNAADDEPTDNRPKQPCQALVLKGRNTRREAALIKRFED